MIVHVASFLESIGGSIDKEHYLRPIPGRVGYAVYCCKPVYSKKKQKEMAGRKMVKQLTEVSKEASAILKDPVRRAEWEAKYRAALREVSKHQRMPDCRAEWEEKYQAALREASKHQRMPDANGKPYMPGRLCDYVRKELAKQAKEG